MSAQVMDVSPAIYVVAGLRFHPAGFKIDAGRALAVAKTSPTVQAIHRAHHPLQLQVNLWVRSHFEVYFSFHGKLLADVLVQPDGRLGPTYTGPLIAGVYARGGYGDLFDSPWVLVPFGLMFLLPLVLLRRRSWLDLLDILMLVSFGVSYALFDTRHLEVGVWLAYPPLLYLLVRMLIRGSRSRPPGRRPVCRLPISVLVAGLVVLVAGRIAVTLIPVSVIDVGYASVIGAHKILHGHSIYFASAGHPDTYGPIAYLAYVPFEAIWPTSGWHYVSAARAASITFDLLTIAGLVLLGTRLRRRREGLRLGLLLAWLWAACPFSVLGMIKSSNDGLVALLVVLTMLSLTAPVRRGVLLGLATAAKFFPAILLPLMAAGRRDGEERPARKVVVGFAIAAGASVAAFLPPGGLKEMYDHTIGFQLSRADVFSPWALHPSLAPVKMAFEAGAIILAFVVAFRPRGQRTPAQMSALAAAVVIAVQLPAIHWFYLYIVWFLPLVLIAVLGVDSPPEAEPDTVLEAVAPLERAERPPALVGAL